MKTEPSYTFQQEYQNLVDPDREVDEIGHVMCRGE